MQLCEVDPSLWVNIDEIYRLRKRTSPVEPKQLKPLELEDLLITCCNRLPKAFLIIDALNESERSSNITRSIDRIQQQCNSARILISSTEELLATQGLLDATIIPMETTQMTEDLDIYILSRLASEESLWNLPQDLKDNIKYTLLEGSSGMY